jgi:2-oxoglutarate dehydrogenase E2 component (dihydrolipoamide succinyltransferase)
MPELGESVTEGTVTRWLKAVGDEVAVDEPLLEVSTDKVDTEIPSPLAGTLLEITAGEDETVEVGGQLAVVGDASAAPAAQESRPEPEPAPAATPDAPAAERGARAPSGQEPMAESSSSNGQVSAQETAAAQERSEREGNVGEWPDRPTADGGQEAGGGGGGEDDAAQAAAPYVTPLVRKLAAEHDVDLSAVSGTGVGGRIRKQDVLARRVPGRPRPRAGAGAGARRHGPAAAAPAAAPQRPTTVAQGGGGRSGAGTTVKMPRLRQVIAQRMSESLQRSAQLTTVQEVDVTRIAKLRAAAKGGSSSARASSSPTCRSSPRPPSRRSRRSRSSTRRSTTRPRR